MPSLFNRETLAEELDGSKRQLAGFLGLVLSLGGLLVIGACALVLLNNPGWWGVAFPALLGVALTAYGVDLTRRGFTQKPHRGSVFDGGLGKARAIVGLVIAVPILLATVLAGASMLANGQVAQNGPFFEAMLVGVPLFGFMAWKCARALRTKRDRPGNGPDLPPGDIEAPPLGAPDPIRETLEPALSHDASTSLALPVEPKICGFWIRLLSLLIDCLLLFLIGAFVGNRFEPQLAALGSWGKPIGFAIAVLYFGFLNSEFGQGQTLGKRLTRIQVVRRNGSFMTLSLSFARASILCLPFFLDGWKALSLTGAWASGPVLGLLGSLVISFGFGIPFFYVLNKQSRQGLHDFLFGTYVVKATEERTALGSVSNRYRMVLAGYLPFVGLVVLGLQLIGQSSGRLQRRLPYLRAMGAIDGVYGATLIEDRTPGTDRKSFIRAEVYWSGHPYDGKSISQLIGRAILEHFPEAASTDSIVVDAFAGYDIGIGQHYSHFNSVASPAEWRAHLAGAPTP